MVARLKRVLHRTHFGGAVSIGQYGDDEERGLVTLRLTAAPDDAAFEDVSVQLSPAEALGVSNALRRFALAIRPR